MKLHTSDLLIICAYLIAMIVIGLILKKRAAQNMDSYFLGGKSLPLLYAWPVQCIRNVRHHRYDANGLLGICLRIQKVSGFPGCGRYSIRYSSWFICRCGCGVPMCSPEPNGSKPASVKGKGATLSHTIVVVFALLSVLGFLSYGFIGIGKIHGNLLFPGKSFHPYIPFTVSPSMFRMYTVSSSQLSPPSTSCWGEC